MSNTPPEDKAKTAAPGTDPMDIKELILEDARARHVYLARMRRELRTPINAIIGYRELLPEDRSQAGLDPKEQKKENTRQADCTAKPAAAVGNQRGSHE